MPGLGDVFANGLRGVKVQTNGAAFVTLLV
jgi:hypothetical protein